MSSSAIDRSRRAFGRGALAGLTALACVTLGAARSGATTGFDGVLGIHGPGTVYAGTDGSADNLTAQVSTEIDNGGIASFPVEVVNTGSVMAQYQVSLYGQSGPVDYSNEQLLTGGVDVTSPAEGGTVGAQGYITNALAPGARQLFTLRIRPPKLASPRPVAFGASLSLASIGGAHQLGSVGAFAVVRTGWPGTDHDVFASSNYQQKSYWMTAPTIKPGATASFQVTTRNSSATKTVQHVVVTQIPITPSGCPTPFEITASAGGKDITAAILGTPGQQTPGYQTPALAAGQTSTLTVDARSVLPHPHAPGCLNTAMIYVDVFAADGDSIAILYVNGAP